MSHQIKGLLPKSIKKKEGTHPSSLWTKKTDYKLQLILNASEDSEKF